MTSCEDDIVITSLGALTPVGETVDETLVAIKAGIIGVSEHAYYGCTPIDPEWDEELTLYASTVPIIDPFMDGLERIIELTIPALTEVLEKADLSRKELTETGLFIALPAEDTATFNLKLYTHYLQLLCSRMGLSGLKLAKINKSGKCGFFEHIVDATGFLKSGDLTYAIVGGVDSYLLEDRMSLMDKAWRLKSERNVDGFIPGEAASMAMLELSGHARGRDMTPIAKITGIALGNESETIKSGKNSTGIGLASAIRKAVDYPSVTEFDTVYCGLNGESYFAFEWGLQLVRLGTLFKNLKHLIHPIENCGEMGAATGGVLLACASKAFAQNKPANDKPALLWLSGDNEVRTALTLAPV